jgi:hypothetical protein
MSIATLLTYVLFAPRFKIYTPHQSRRNPLHHLARPSAPVMLLARLDEQYALLRTETEL